MEGGRDRERWMAGRTFPRRKVRRILGQRERLKVIDISLPLHSFHDDEKSTCAIGKWPCLSVCLICLPSCQVREDCSHLARISAEVKRCNRRLRLGVSWEGRRDRRVSVLWRRRRRWPTDEYWLETGKEGKIGRGFREVEADRDVERKLKVGKEGWVQAVQRPRNRNRRNRVQSNPARSDR